MGLTVCENIINILNGKQIEITYLNINHIYDLDSLKVTIGVLHNSDFYVLDCYGVTSLCIEDFSYPIIISGLEIIDNSLKGWQKEKRYYFHDFEENAISFYCEKIEYQIGDCALI